MPRGDLPALTRLDVADDPGVWTALGFSVGADATVRVGAVELRLTGSESGSGVTGWGMHASEPLPVCVDGIATDAYRLADEPEAAHANGATRIDHVVVATPDLDRTLAALTALGLHVSRVRETGQPRLRARQAFVWSGDVILEVAGPATAEGDGPATLWGLVVVAPAIDVVQALPGAAVGTIRDAVQVGRRIAPVRREAGSSVPLAFITPHIGRMPAEQEPTPA